MKSLIIALLFAVPVFAQELPNPELTPGLVRTSDSSEICAKSFRTKPYRHTTKKMKKDVCQAYGITKGCPGKKYEIDHLIPLEISGMDDERNLWPQPALPLPGYHQKDKLENMLKRMVCRGDISLADAQIQIATNWYLAYQKYVLHSVQHQDWLNQ